MNRLQHVWQRLRGTGTPQKPQASYAVTGGAEPPFKGASYFRRAGALWGASSGSANADLEPHRTTLRARSRQLKRNNPLAAGALRTLRDNVIGPGLRLHPAIDRDVLDLTDSQADSIEKQLQQLWLEWSESYEADLNRISDGNGLQQLAFDSCKESGDVLALVPMVQRPGARFRTRVQLVESDRIQNPAGRPDTERLVAGVELDQYGAPTAYHVRRVHPGNRSLGFMGTQESQRVQAFGINSGRRIAWLLLQRSRTEQSRGIPYLAGVLEQLKQLERYTDGELQAAIVAGAFTVFVKTDAGTGLQPLASYNMQPNPQPLGSQDLMMDYAAVLRLAKGESIEVADPGRPNTAFGDFVRAMVEQIGAGLGQPYEVLLKRFTASYSAARAALLEANKFFKSERQWFSASYCDPVYEAVLTEAVARGFIALPGFLEQPYLRNAYLNCEWIGPTMGQLNPQDEIKAAALRIETGVSTLAYEAAEITGQNWEKINTQRRKENDARKAAGLLDATGAPVSAEPDRTPPPSSESGDSEEADDARQVA